MTRNTAPTGKSGHKSVTKAAATPRQIALVVPHATADAGVTFESALEVLDHDLHVHKLWQAKQPKSPAKRPAKQPG